MQALILHPKNKGQLALFKKLAKEMGVLFETKEAETVYSESFVNMVLQGDEDSKNGLGRKVSLEELDDLWK